MQKTLKSMIRPWVPEALMDLRRNWMFSRNRGRDLESIFSEIYAKHLWGGASLGRFWSGWGSSPEASQRYEDFVVSFLNERSDVSSILDIGCGDFQVSARILKKASRRINYIGADVVPDLISHNASSYAGDHVRFVRLDASIDELPAADVVIIRQVLQHLSNEVVVKVLQNARRISRYGIITEDVRHDAAAGPPNLDIVSGRWTRGLRSSGLFVDKPPFNLPVASELTVPLDEKSSLRTLVVKWPA